MHGYYPAVYTHRAKKRKGADGRAKVCLEFSPQMGTSLLEIRSHLKHAGPLGYSLSPRDAVILSAACFSKTF